MTPRPSPTTWRPTGARTTSPLRWRTASRTPPPPWTCTRRTRRPWQADVGLRSFFKDVGDAAASGIHAVSSGLNTVDRYINPFHVEQGSTRTGDSPGNSFLGNV